jgi:cardiolipin synthase
MFTIILTIILTAVVTMVAFVIGFNLVNQQKRVQHKIKSTFSVDDAQFCRAASNLLSRPLCDGNKIETLSNGCKYFPAMLEAIRSAEHSITFESFIYVSGEIGKQFSDAFIERCKAGVRVHVLCDFMGSWRMRKTHLQELIDAGISVELYRPPRLANLVHFTNRTHRKILVIDGKVAFTGGAGIADEWDGDADREDCWRDNQYRITGPLVAAMQGAFMDNWMQTHAEVLKDESYFPELHPTGDITAQVFLSGPGEGLESARLMFLLSISCARKSIRIGNAYFVPDNFVIDALVEARRRGVDVEIIVPRLIDTPYVIWASVSRWGPLLKSGCRIYRFQGALYHCKLLVVDDHWVSIGSSNFDTRSFRLNDEMNVNVLNREFAQEQVEIFSRDKARSKEVTLQEWENRGLWEKIRGRIAAVGRSQM